MNKKKAFLSAAALAATSLFAYSVWDNFTLETERITAAFPGLPASFSGLRILQISDLHNVEFGKNNQKLLQACVREQPDLIIITGDLMDREHPDCAKVLRFVRSLLSLAPVFYVTGNHEAEVSSFPAVRAGLASMGVHLLGDRAVFLRRGSDRISLVGLDDPLFSGRDSRAPGAKAMLDAKLRRLVQKDKFTILLTHHPEFFPLYQKHGIQLIFAGHAHGGQIRLPGIGGLYAPGQGLFPAYTSGLCKEGPSQMVVSRGLDTSNFPFRFRNHPELVTLTLKTTA